MTETAELMREQLVSAIAKTMENMTFAAVEFVEDDSEVEFYGENNYWAILPVVDPIQLVLALEIPKICAQGLAAEVYGDLEVEPDEEVVLDIVAEMLNTLAGRLMSGIVDSNETFELGLPSKGEGEMPSLKSTDESVFVKVDEHYLKVSVVDID